MGELPVIGLEERLELAKTAINADVEIAATLRLIVSTTIRDGHPSPKGMLDEILCRAYAMGAVKALEELAVIDAAENAIRDARKVH